jgi:sodium-dependent dicarboxylate transporter 2/3/5
MNVELKNRIFLVVAFAVFPVFWALPTPEGLSYAGKMMLAILASAIILWVTEALPYSISGLLIMILQPLLIPSLEASDVFSAFGNGAVFFLLGAFILAAAIEKYDLHKRAALRFLKLFGSSSSMFILGIMLSGALLSFIMPEHGVVALLIPIVMFILVALRLRPLESNFGRASVIGVTYGCSIGSLGTIIGGARNPLTVGFLETEGIEVTFLDWMLLSMPVVFLTLPLAWLILIRVFPPEEVNLKELTGLLSREVEKLGPMVGQQKVVMGVLMGTIVMWVFFSREIGLAVIAIASGVILFMTRSLEWGDVEEKVPWGILLLYGGAISLGSSLTATGAASWLADGLLTYMGDNPLMLIITLITLGILLTNMMSNTAAVAVLLPISVSLARATPYVTETAGAMTIALGSGLAFVLVIATPGNLIAYSTGYFTTRDLMRSGVLVSLASILVLFLVAISWWRFIGVW